MTVKVDSVFITKDHQVMIVVEDIDDDVAIFRYVTARHPTLVGKTYWAYVANLTNGTHWYQLV